MSNRVGAGSLIATLVVFGIGASTAFAQAPECAGKNAQLSKKISKPMTGALDALKAQKWDEVLAKTQEAADNPAPKSLYDEFWIHNLLGKAHTGLKQYPEAVKEFELIKDSVCMSDTERADFFRLMTKIYYQLDNDAKVIETANRALALAPDPDLPLYLGQAYYRTKDYANSLKVMNEIVAKLEEQGKPPGEQNVRLIHGACTQLKDDECATRQYEKLVKYYPKPEYWQNLVNTLFNDRKSTDKQQLNFMRLARYADAVKEPSKYEEIAQIALDQGLPGEAQSVIEEGFAKKFFVDPRSIERANSLLAKAKAAAASDKATIAQQDAAARAAANGNADVKMGAAYLSYGENDKAIEALQRGITKGGVKDPDEAGILLGIAFLRSGNKAEAAKAFNTVSKDPTMTRVAKLWLLNT